MGDAIVLSGLTGTRLKCDVIGDYYRFWWNITSGGPSKNFENPTTIVELNAGTGEVYIEETNEKVLGSAGHALDLKVKRSPDTKNLKLVLIEENYDCYNHLKNVISRRWPSISVKDAEMPIESNMTNVYLLNKTLNDATEATKNLDLGNALYFFDPLRCVEYRAVQKVADERITAPFKTGTEFFIFLFTSDWFLGRDDFSPLPCSPNESTWTEQERKTVLEADSLFGEQNWRDIILSRKPIDHKESLMVEQYKNRLHRWFRYVLPLPFSPKRGQLFHLILCSNFETGIRMTRNNYTTKTGNPKYKPNNERAFQKFRRLHPELFTSLKGRKRPLEWRILWSIITSHEEGLCDPDCRDIMKMEPNEKTRLQSLEWLQKKGYLELIAIENAWGIPINRYRLRWRYIREKLGINPPPPLRPVTQYNLDHVGANICRLHKNGK